MNRGILEKQRGINFLWWGIAILFCCVVWAAVAVFLWKGNLLP